MRGWVFHRWMWVAATATKKQKKWQLKRREEGGHFVRSDGPYLISYNGKAIAGKKRQTDEKGKKGL